MCTIGAITQEGKTFLLKNFDYRPVPTGWAYFEAFEGEHRHFALVDHGQQGVNSGLNAAGLGLLISRSRLDEPDSPEREELRTVLNAEVLAACGSLEEGTARLERYAAEHPEMFGGNVILAEAGQISVSEYFGGRAQSAAIRDGYLARANHSVFGLVDNVTTSSQIRYERMVAFLQELYVWFPALDRDDVVERCRGELRREPILNGSTRSSLVIDVQERRVDYLVGDGPWKVFWMDEAGTAR
jgi:hypothetical protein